MDPRISGLIDSLPTLTKDDVDIHDYCPICFIDFKTILDTDDSEPEGVGAGLTRLSGCSHVFCRKDLIQWICSWHGSCPTCRDIFLSNLSPRSESDDESDGGEYDPDESEASEDEYEDDGYDSFEGLDDSDIEEELEEELEEEMGFSMEDWMRPIYEFEDEEDDHVVGLRLMEDWMDSPIADPSEEELAEEEAHRREALQVLVGEEGLAEEEDDAHRHEDLEVFVDEMAITELGLRDLEECYFEETEFPCEEEQAEDAYRYEELELCLD